MNCRDFTEFLNLYFDGELSARERAVFDEHLAECPDCTAYLQNYAETVRLGRAAFTGNGAVPAEVPADLVTAILAALKRQ
jgi:anti-sigma factor RsiW